MIGSWIDDDHPTLGAGVFRFTGPDALAVYECGLVHSEDRRTITFADILDFQLLPLHQLAQAKTALGDVEFTVRTKAGDAVLKLPVVHYSSLSAVLQEQARRAQRNKI